MTGMDRRSFLSRGAALAGGSLLASGSLQTLTTRLASATPGAAPGQENKGSYGRLRPVAADNERGGVAYLALPDGFSYVVLSRIGDRMTDGNVTPAQLDGMAAFAGPDGAVRLIRNHEIRSADQVQVGGPVETRYDPTGGGTTTLDYDPHRRQLVRDFVSLNGTVVNCAGGKGLGDRSWITGEEIITTIGGKKHGYNFEVPLARSGPALTQPLVAMGRFAHEAVATDPASGIVYETEDAGSGRGSGFYRYIDAPDANPLAATNGDGLASGTSGPFAEGYAKGGAKFNRLEGIWYGDGGIFFDSTSGGDAKSPEAPNADGYREGYGQINRLVGLTRSGEAFEFAINRFNDSELAGPCFSPDATTLFVNIFGDGTAGSGMTVAIRGPWARGAL